MGMLQHCFNVSYLPVINGTSCGIWSAYVKKKNVFFFKLFMVWGNVELSRVQAGICFK